MILDADVKALWESLGLGCLRSCYCVVSRLVQQSKTDWACECEDLVERCVAQVRSGLLQGLPLSLMASERTESAVDERTTRVSSFNLLNNSKEMNHNGRHQDLELNTKRIQRHKERHWEGREGAQWCGAYETCIHHLACLVPGMIWLACRACMQTKQPMGGYKGQE